MGKYLISWGIVSPVADSLPRTQDTCQFKNRKVHSVFTKPHHCPVLKSIWYPCKLPRHVSLRPIFYVIVPSTSLFFKCSVSLSFKLSNVNFIMLSWQYKSWSLWLCGFLSCPLTGPPYVTISSPPNSCCPSLTRRQLLSRRIRKYTVTVCRAWFLAECMAKCKWLYVCSK